MISGYILGQDSWDDTGFLGKHAYDDEFFQGKSVNVTLLKSTLGYNDNLPIAHSLYAFDQQYGTVVVIEYNNTIYMGDKMINSLDNPIQCKYNDVRIDVRPKVYYHNSNNAHSITFPYVTSIPVEYDVVLS